MSTISNCKLQTANWKLEGRLNLTRPNDDIRESRISCAGRCQFHRWRSGNGEKSACDFSGSQSLFGNAIIFVITQPKGRGFHLCFAGDATELPGHRRSQTEFGNEAFLSHAPISKVI